MPGATLTIEKNVEVHIWPNVRILVLGNLIVDGTLWQPTRFKPINITEYEESRGRISTRYRRNINKKKNVFDSIKTNRYRNRNRIYDSDLRYLEFIRKRDRRR